MPRQRQLRALDLFCGGGGAAMGLHRAGFRVTGVDIQPQPHYPFRFRRADALAFPLDGYDFIWASPPCQAFTPLRHMPTARPHENLIPETRAKLLVAGVPFCIENVPGAPLGDSGYLTMLCGTMFGLQTADGRAELRRHRWFETSFSIGLRPQCQHGGSVVPVYGNSCSGKGSRKTVLTVVGHTPVDNRRAIITVTGTRCNSANTARRRSISVTGSTPQTNVVTNVYRETYTVVQAREAMGIDWLPMSRLSQAIPPAYAEFIGREAIQFLKHRAATRDLPRMERTA